MSDFAHPGHAAYYLVRAATTAPSLHNTQPWLFVGEEQDRGLELHADTSRQLPLTDPYGRELVISCGAALFTLRLAMRRLGFAPRVACLPRPRDPAFLARVGWGVCAAPTADEALMFAALPRRHTVRGPLRPDPLPVPLIRALREQAHAEGAALRVLAGPDEHRLANIVRAAEHVHRTTPGHTAELAQWSWPSGQRRLDGIPDDACAFHPDCTPFALRDYTRLTRDVLPPLWHDAPRTGLVCVLTTAHDNRLDWLRAGQALQRVLLYAAAHQVMAAFPTQPLEQPRLRARVRAGIAGGRAPQVILRLGYAPRLGRLPRRPPPRRSRPPGHGPATKPDPRISGQLRLSYLACRCLAMIPYTESMAGGDTDASCDTAGSPCSLDHHSCGDRRSPDRV
ncbi:Acg family FMN-binding oxidoreductase [Streptomyces sp. NPDC059063]|uniref:Acg family FMN-binding oxidoreductase n=1 Tax=unclassified Streptomyces TaxID=2593676 RepID=UPI0036BD37A5